MVDQLAYILSLGILIFGQFAICLIYLFYSFRQEIRETFCFHKWDTNTGAGKLNIEIDRLDICEKCGKTKWIRIK